ncbi:MAG: YqaJ viral recombinase family protein [Brevundimonas sp.]|nr:YqaJ viral recombinase family protein [Brevundimonas sp.]
MPPPPHIAIHAEMIQGGDDWLAARCGLLTASEMKLIVTPGTLKATSNEKERAHLYELMAQRVTKYVEPHYVSDDMLRGRDDELEARALYHQHFAPVTEVGFITNNRWGFTIGYSPDGLVGEDGGIECKGRRQKFQLQTIVDRKVPDEFVIQLQTGLLVSERKWIDFISYCGGLPMVTLRVFPDPVIQAAILDAASAFERRLADKMAIYLAETEGNTRLIPTERRIEQEMFV